MKEDNSQIFFTIFRNKYLNSVIFESIKYINRYKKSLLDPDIALSYIREYKYINNIRWMVSFGHFGLLKEKLQRNEFLLLDSESCIYGIVSKVHDKETFEILFEKYRDEFRNYSESLMSIAIKHGNISAIQVLQLDQEYKNNKDIKMIDLAITSGKVETLDYVIVYLKNQKEEFDLNGGTGTSSSVLESNFTRNNLIKNIFSCPMNLLASMIDCIFDPNSVASFLNINIEDLKSNQNYRAQFSDIFSLLPFKYLKFFLENNLVLFDSSSFVNAFNAFTPFTNEINSNSFLDYLKKFVYCFSNYYKNSTKQYLDSISERLPQIEEMVELLNCIGSDGGNSEKEKQLIELLEKVEYYKPIIGIRKTAVKQVKAGWGVGMTNAKAKIATHKLSNAGSIGLRSDNDNNNINSKDNNDSNDNSDSSNDNEEDNSNTKTIEIYENKIFGEHDNITLEKRVLNKMINLYIYIFFYPISELFQVSKREITVNKFAIFRKDLNIIKEAKMVFKGFEEVKLKYIGFKEILAYSLKAADISILKDFLSFYNEDPFEIVDHSDLFNLPFDFGIFQYCINNLQQQKDYLIMLVKLKKSFLKKFQYSNIFCWLSNLPHKLSNTLMNLLRDSLLLLPYDINKEHLTNKSLSVAYKAVLNNSYHLVEYVVINRDFFEILDNVVIKAIFHNQYEIVNLFLSGGVEFPEGCDTHGIRVKNIKMLKLLLDGGIEATKQAIKEAATEHMVEQFRLLVSRYPKTNNEAQEGEFSLLGHLVGCNQLFLRIIREEFTKDFEDGLFGDPAYILSVNAEDKISKFRFKLNTAQLLRKENFQDIYSYTQDIIDDENIREKAFNSIIYESLENFQFECFYRILEIFHSCANFLNNNTEIKLKLITYLVKNNHYYILLYLIRDLKISFDAKEFNQIFSKLDLDCDYISKEVLLISFEWIKDFQSCVQLVSSTLFLLMDKAVSNNRFSLFKFLNESFFRFNQDNMPPPLAKKLSSSLNIHFSIYLHSTLPRMDYPLIVESIKGYSEEIVIKKPPAPKKKDDNHNDYLNYLHDYSEPYPQISYYNLNKEKKKKKCLIQ